MTSDHAQVVASTRSEHPAHPSGCAADAPTAWLFDRIGDFIAHCEDVAAGSGHDLARPRIRLRTSPDTLDRLRRAWGKGTTLDRHVLAEHFGVVVDVVPLVIDDLIYLDCAEPFLVRTFLLAPAELSYEGAELYAALRSDALTGPTPADALMAARQLLPAPVA